MENNILDYKKKKNVVKWHDDILLQDKWWKLRSCPKQIRMFVNTIPCAYLHFHTFHFITFLCIFKYLIF